MAYSYSRFEELKQYKRLHEREDEQDIKFIGQVFTSKKYGDFRVLGVYDFTKDNQKKYMCLFLESGGLGLATKYNIKKGEVSDSSSRHYAYDLKDRRFDKLVAIKLIKEKNKKRRWLCKCDCGKEIIVEQRNLLGKKYTQRSCGCIRKKAHLIKSSKIPLTLEEIEYYDNFEKYAFLHKSFVSLKKFKDNKENIKEYKKSYSNFIEKFYYDEQFNKIYNNWSKTNINKTFYDWLKPSLDHIIPSSRGGDSSLNNLQFITVFENLSKRDMTLEEWNSFLEETNTTSDLFIKNMLGGEG